MVYLGNYRGTKALTTLGCGVVFWLFGTSNIACDQHASLNDSHLIQASLAPLDTIAALPTDADQLSIEIAESTVSSAHFRPQSKPPSQSEKASRSTDIEQLRPAPVNRADQTGQNVKNINPILQKSTENHLVEHDVAPNNLRKKPGRRIGLYNTLELEFSDAYKIKSWASVAPQLTADQNRISTCLHKNIDCGTELNMHWVQMLKSINSSDRMDVIKRINYEANQVPYKSDLSIHGTSDKWSAPSDFLRYGGDCEDYAILKMVSLAALGVPSSDMRIVVGRLDNDQPHAVLSVATPHGEMILDNRKNQILYAEFGDFKPKYSMNFEKRWTHIAPKPTVLYAHNTAK